MRYLVLVPETPTDPRELDLPSTAKMHEVLRVVVDCESEQEAAEYVRSKHSDAVAMPVPMRLGSDDIVLLGFVEDPGRPIDPDGEIPFVMFVQRVAENHHDRGSIKANPKRPFERKFWKIPVIKPDLASTYQVDLRSSELEVPTFTSARVGSRDGRLVIYMEIGGTELSIKFEDPRVQLMVTSGAPDRVTADVRDVVDLDRLSGV